MKKILALVLAAVMMLSCTAALADTEIVVFAATSMTASLTKVAEMYMAANPGVTVTLNFGSSGTLLTQIKEGAECDVFISAAQKQMNALDATVEGGEDYIDPATRVDLLENKLALAVPEGNPAGIESIQQVVDLLNSGDILVAMGNSDVPCGQYTQKLFVYFGVDEAGVAAKLSYGNNVGEVAQQIVAGSVSCGFIYHTDAYTYGLQVVEEATSDMVGGRVIYPAAMLRQAKDADACAAFLAYLQGEEASAAFAEVGFTPLGAQQ